MRERERVSTLGISINKTIAMIRFTPKLQLLIRNLSIKNLLAMLDQVIYTQ